MAYMMPVIYDDLLGYLLDGYVMLINVSLG